MAAKVDKDKNCVKARIARVEIRLDVDSIELGE
jgi:hypothetical protein